MGGAEREEPETRNAIFFNAKIGEEREIPRKRGERAMPCVVAAWAMPYLVEANSRSNRQTRNFKP